MDKNRAAHIRVLFIDFDHLRIYESSLDAVKLTPTTSMFAGAPWHLQPKGGRDPGRD